MLRVWTWLGTVVVIVGMHWCSGLVPLAGLGALGCCECLDAVILDPACRS